MVKVRYFVDDPAVAEHFYVDYLGFSRAVQLGSAVRVVERNGVSLWLTSTGTAAARRRPSGALPRPGGWNRLVVKVDDLEGLIDRLVDDGHAAQADSYSGTFGLHAVVYDPSGNPVELFQPVAG